MKQYKDFDLDLNKIKENSGSETLEFSLGPVCTYISSKLFESAFLTKCNSCTCPSAVCSVTDARNCINVNNEKDSIRELSGC
ncbi:hypothetical protein HKO22_10230 [Peptoniphilus sp. AGMB00490]|uniref:Uncharacterized protein n=2 Tax=Peptoniphilus TaxID=162289 RepID=A0ACD6AZ96_9FIRM|nr:MULTISPECIES: hypothetical protein [Peptoniphilus]NMW86082.1 hypothetical protein [Peptoniphilus faecalis]OLR64676.1 hypothetical protein BIV18_03550 [Peptoniphilus porci]